MANAPSLERLSISNQGQNADEFKMDLPELTHIDMEYCSVSSVMAKVTMLADNNVLRRYLLSCHKCAE